MHVIANSFEEEKEMEKIDKFVCYSIMYQSNQSLHIPPPPGAYPGHLTLLPAREGGHLITTHVTSCFDSMWVDK